MTDENYGTEVSIEELKGHYETNFMTSDQFIDLVMEWHKSEVKKLTLTDVSQQRELLDAFVCTMEFDIKHEFYEEDINYFLENVKADNCG